MDFNKGALIETDSRRFLSSHPIGRRSATQSGDYPCLRRRRHGRRVELRKVRQQVVRHRLLVLLLLQSELEALGADNKYVFSVDQYGY